MDRKRPSGAEYKRRKKHREEEERKKISKIETFFQANKKPDADCASTSNVDNNSVEQQEVENNDVVATSAPTLTTGTCSLLSEPNSSSAAYNEAKASTSSRNEKSSIIPLINATYPTDRGHYPGNISDEDVNFKQYIIKHGSCRPKGPFPRDNKGRSFSEYYYEIQTVPGITIPRTWLCYSVKLNKVYCEPCWLFGNPDRHHTKSFHDSCCWSRGICDWQGLSTKIKEHELTRVHANACIVYDQWRLHGRIDQGVVDQMKKEQNFWRKVIVRILDVTLTLADCNLAFRGHCEKTGKPDSGNFLAIIELLSHYDPVLKELLEKPQGTVKYLSPRIQNELIDLLSKRLQENILEEVRAAPFYAIVTDTTQDISKRDQMSEILRYVTVLKDDNGKPTQVKINEAFLGFQDITDQSAASLVKNISESLEEKDLPLSKCRGQGYDGAAVMSGIYSGVQARIASQEKTAVFVHCAAHNLNLVLNDAVNGVPEVNKFFETVQALYVFFGASIKRWSLLTSKVQVKGINPTCELTLKKLCTTRWSSRLDSIMAVRHRYLDINKALTDIALRSKSSKEKSEAIGLKKRLEKYDFVFILVFWYDVLKNVNFVSKLLQSSNFDLSQATSHLKQLKETLTTFRNNFEDKKNEATSLAKDFSIEVKFEDKRTSLVKRHFDELSQDERLTDPERRFKCAVFFSTLDILISQVTNRFESMNLVVQRFGVLIPSSLTKMSDEELVHGAGNLVAFYDKDLSPSLEEELLSFRSAMNEDIAKAKSVSDLAHLLLVENSTISSSFPNVCIAVMLFLTIPVTVATAERSFSKLKLTKNYLRSTMGQSRLSGLSILSIENKRARNLSIEKMVEEFAEMKARKKDFN